VDGDSAERIFFGCPARDLSVSLPSFRSVYIAKPASRKLSSLPQCCHRRSGLSGGLSDALEPARPSMRASVFADRAGEFILQLRICSCCACKICGVLDCAAISATYQLLGGKLWASHSARLCGLRVASFGVSADCSNGETASVSAASFSFPLSLEAKFDLVAKRTRTPEPEVKARPYNTSLHVNICNHAREIHGKPLTIRGCGLLGESTHSTGRQPAEKSLSGSVSSVGGCAKKRVIRRRPKGGLPRHSRGGDLLRRREV